MNNKITIVMYHYVRDLKHSRYPKIKGLDIRLFKEQIGYLLKHYNIITMETLIDCIQNKTTLPKKSALLTFDDGYSDHFKYVYPILDKYNIQGSFFPPAKILAENKILDVNKIHYILASDNDKSIIVKEIENELHYYRKDFNLLKFSDYYNKLASPSKYDTAEVVFIKRMLQVELDEHIRKNITNTLFEKFIDLDEKSFCNELYMNLNQLKYLLNNGMHIGSHGYNHYWLGSLNKSDQQLDIDRSLDFLSTIGVNTNNWTICFPYGDYNNTTLEILKKSNCALGLTTNVNIADIGKFNRFTLPRLDTNDLPKDKDIRPNKWYLEG